MAKGCEQGLQNKACSISKLHIQVLGMQIFLSLGK